MSLLAPLVAACSGATTAPPAELLSGEYAVVEVEGAATGIAVRLLVKDSIVVTGSVFRTVYATGTAWVSRPGAATVQLPTCTLNRRSDLRIEPTPALTDALNLQCEAPSGIPPRLLLSGNTPRSESRLATARFSGTLLVANDVAYQSAFVLTRVD